MMGLVLSCVLAVPAAGPDRGLEIARAADEADSGWGAETATATMTITAGGRTQTRGFRLTTTDTDPERSLVELLEPARHRGMKVLTLASRDGADQVFVHFPKHGRTRRIVGRKRTGRFLGSELTFEDLGSRKHYRYTHTFLRTESCGGGQARCHVVETRPKDPDSGYSRILLWRQTDDYRLHRVDWYGRAGDTLVKTGRFSDWKRFGRFPRPMRYEVESATTGRKTVLRFTSRNVGITLPDGALTRAQLDR